MYNEVYLIVYHWWDSHEIYKECYTSLHEATVKMAELNKEAGTYNAFWGIETVELK